MKLRFTLILAFLCSLQTVSAQELIQTNKKDSLFIEIDPERGRYVQHIVDNKQTLYSISRYYSCNLQELYNFNGKSNDWVINPGDLIQIPFTKTQLLTEKSDVKELIPLFYRVKAKDNIFRISKIYFSQSIQVMQKRNELPDLSMDIGQVLHIGWLNQNVQTQEKPKVIDSDQALQMVRILDSVEMTANIDSSVLQKKNDLFVEKDSLQDNRIFKSEHGIAIWNKESSDRENLYAMHRTAKINSLIEIHNPLLNRTAFAKVVSRMTEGLYPDDVDIIITPRVADSLGMKDRRFRVLLKFYE